MYGSEGLRAYVCCSDNSQKTIRRKVEKELGLEDGVLDEVQYKSVLRELVQEAIVSAASHIVTTREQVDHLRVIE